MSCEFIPGWSTKLAIAKVPQSQTPIARFPNKCHSTNATGPLRPESIRNAATADLASNLEALKKGRHGVEAGLVYMGAITVLL